MNQKPNIIDKLDLAIIKHDMDLKAALKELDNQNLTHGQIRALHVEIEQNKFALKTLKSIKNDD